VRTAHAFHAPTAKTEHNISLKLQPMLDCSCWNVMECGIPRHFRCILQPSHPSNFAERNTLKGLLLFLAYAFSLAVCVDDSSFCFCCSPRITMRVPHIAQHYQSAHLLPSLLPA